MIGRQVQSLDLGAYFKEGLQLQANGKFDEGVAALRQGCNIVEQSPHILEQVKKQDHIAWLVFTGAAMCCNTTLVQAIWAHFFPHFSRFDNVRISHVSTCRSWCEANNAPYQLEGLPEHIDFVPSHNYSARRKYITDPRFWSCIPGGYVVPGWDMAITPDMMVLSDSGAFYSTTFCSPYMPHIYTHGRLHLSEDFELPAAALLDRDDVVKDELRVVHPWSSNIVRAELEVLLFAPSPEHQAGHWLLDFLPRLQIFDMHDLAGVKICITRDLPEKFRSSLRLFGFSNDDLFECEPGKVYQFDAVYVFQPGHYIRPNQENISYLRKHLSIAAPRPEKKVADKVFLSRDNRTRAILNQEEVFQFLEERGFVFLNLAELSFQEQRNKLSSAALIISVFGSDLLGALMAPEGATLLELTWEPDQDPCMGPICSMIGLNHHFLVCRSFKPSNKYMKKDRDIRVNLRHLEERLELIKNLSMQ